MKRDMELIRQIAFLIEKAPGELHSGSIRIDGFTGPQIDYHCELMADWNLIKLIYFTSLRTENGEYAIERLTTTGHDFVDAVRNEKVWKNTIEKLTEEAIGDSIDLMLACWESESQMLGMSGE